LIDAVELSVVPPESLTPTQKLADVFRGEDVNVLLFVPTGFDVSPLVP
jgi:hypothetical protein